MGSPFEYSAFAFGWLYYTKILPAMKEVFYPLMIFLFL